MTATTPSPQSDPSGATVAAEPDQTFPGTDVAPQPGAGLPGEWSAGLGRAGARAAQTLLIAAVVVGTVWLLLRVSLVVIATLVALILASAVSPAVRWLVARGWAHLWATLVVFLGMLVLVAGVITGVVLAVRNEWDSLTSSAVEGWEQFQEWLASGPLPLDTAVINDATTQVTEYLSSGSFAGGLTSSTLTGLSAATQFLTGMVLMIVMLFFFLKDGSGMVNFALRWFRGGTRARLAESVDRTREVLGGYVRGTALVAAVDAGLIGIGLAIVGVPLALPLAVIVFLGAFIPIVGATVAGVLAALVALVTNGPVAALIVIAIVVGVQQVEGNLLQPVVMGRTLSLHPLIVLLALTIGTMVGGVFGAVLAVPYTAVGWTMIQIWTDRYQKGHDPVLGDDPLSEQDRAQSKASRPQRRRYQRMRTQQAPKTPLGATESGANRLAADANDAEAPDAEAPHAIQGQ